MRRREFITLLGGAAVAWPLAARTQEVGRSYRIGLLNPLPREMPQFVSLFDELRRFGFVEGQNVIVDGRGFRSRPEHFAERAVEIVKSGVDVLICGGDAAIRAAQQATATVPLLGISDDMLARGHVSSLARPGGNITGISILATELDGKRQEILMELMPSARRMAALADPATKAPQQLEELQDAARGRGVELLIYRVARPEEIGPAIDAAHNSGVQAINVLATALLNAHRRLIFERTAALRCPRLRVSRIRRGRRSYRLRLTYYRNLSAGRPSGQSRFSRVPSLAMCQLSNQQNSSWTINLKAAKALGLKSRRPCSPARTK